MRDRNTTGQAAKSKSWFRRWLPALIPFPSECRDRKVEIPRPLGRNGGTKCLGAQAFPLGMPLALGY